MRSSRSNPSSPSNLPSRHNSDHPPAGDQRDAHKVFARTKDEQIVNDALLELLRALTLNLPNTRCQWCSSRLAFKVHFGIIGMEARTDGYLGRRSDSINEDAFAILEAKARVRSRNTRDLPIYMQESAEMVSWIRRDQAQDRQTLLPTIKGDSQSRLLIAQDRQEIFVIIARSDNNYEQYLRGEYIPSSSFMTMQEYGPFRVQSAKNMHHLAEFVIGFCLEVDKLILV